MDPDDEPYLAFYDKESDLGFVWDGKSPEIRVSNGEFFKVEGTVGVRNASISKWMDWFKLVCCNYVRLKETG